TWLHRIAVSVTLNAMRKWKRFRQRETELEEADSLPASVVEAEPDLKVRLRAAINALPELYRTVVVMHDVEDYTHGEIARILGVPEGTSKARLSVARARLREALADFARE
ncbi:MAG: RNA polymerase sigma factor, partial [Gemmatimonadaceae bacterium]